MYFVSWKLIKQHIVLRSSVEAEYSSIGSTLSETILSIAQWKPVLLHCDSNVAIQLVANPILHESTKHIEIVCHYIREKILHGVVQTRYVKSSE